MNHLARCQESDKKTVRNARFQTDSLELEDILADHNLSTKMTNLIGYSTKQWQCKQQTDPAPSICPPPPQCSVMPLQRFFPPVDKETIRVQHQQLSVIPAAITVSCHVTITPSLLTFTGGISCHYSMLSSFWFVLLLGLALALATNHREDEAKEDAKSVDLY